MAAVLRKVCSLFALSNIIDGHQWHGKIDSTTFGLVETAVAELLAELRPDAVPLVDAFDFSDRVSGYAHTHALPWTHIHTHTCTLQHLPLAVCRPMPSHRVRQHHNH